MALAEFFILNLDQPLGLPSTWEFSDLDILGILGILGYSRVFKATCQPSASLLLCQGIQTWLRADAILVYWPRCSKSAAQLFQQLTLELLELLPYRLILFQSLFQSAQVQELDLWLKLGLLSIFARCNWIFWQTRKMTIDKLYLAYGDGMAPLCQHYLGSYSKVYIMCVNKIHYCV